MTPEWTILSGTAHPGLASAIARALGVGLSACTVERFPDGEVSVRVDQPVRGREVVLIQPTSPPVDQHLIELLALADACRRASAARITAVIPYFGYARSDKRHGHREPIAASLVARLIQAVGIAQVIAVDLHTPQIEGSFQIPLDTLTAVPILCEAIRPRLPAGAIIVAPDAGRVKMATHYAERLVTPLAVLHKRRVSSTKIAVTHLVGNVRGQPCVLVDDIISTGGTIAESAAALRQAGAGAILVAATHGLFVGPARDQLNRETISEVFVTDTIAPAGGEWPRRRVVPIAPLLAGTIRRFMADGSQRPVLRSRGLLRDMRSSAAEPICLFLCGDVMTGRGIDQILPHPGDPTLYEPYVRDARIYVQLAEKAHGPIPRPVDFAYIWGEAPTEPRRAGADVRIVNLETSLTANKDPWPGKPVLYRMHPRNIGCLTAAHIDCCCLANNHVLDWGYHGLEETLQTLDNAGIVHTGVGRCAADAASPAVVGATGKGRVLVLALGSITSGIPRAWAAADHRPGVNLLEDLSEASARRIAGQLRRHKQPDDVTVASIHWGPNWGYEIPPEQTRFAHRLIEEGIDIVHGHSSHHVKTIEVYRGRLILYGCGDFLTDYEGISGYERFRGDLALMYLVKVDPRRGRLEAARLVPLQSRQFRLSHATAADAAWLCDLLNRLGAPVGTRVQLKRDHSMTLRVPFEGDHNMSLRRWPDRPVVD